MAVSKPKKPQRIPEDVDLLKSDVASFASSLGLAAGAEKKKDTPKLPLMKAGLLSGQWYVDADELEIKVLGEEGRRKVPALGIEGLKVLAAKKKEIAEMLMEQYAKDYDVSRRKKGDLRLLEMTARSGTSADKVSAFTCLVEDNPIANIRSLDALLSMVTSKVGKRYAFTGFEALRELFLLRLLPDRKLKSLLQHPLDALPETKDGFSLLLFWYWEECLKQRYERFVIALEEALKDMLPNLKDKAMKAVVIDEVDSFIFRPHIGTNVLISDVRGFDNRIIEKGSEKGNEKGKQSYKKKTSTLHNKEGSIESIEMDSRLLSALLTPEMFLGLLFKAMKNDVNLKRVSAFSKRLLQVSNKDYILELLPYVVIVVMSS
ncbi:hypothetical protein J5N97_009325 [Dioscorea zingiberensis]|uniref:Uncharacterized protein n=1 Tax=Dioscorea zingiberensis TaxID=325984 RepID=A0A9D5CZ84_9LILI|nr:hypothetical protein J5N97_009325 [Dioscorea zingiberensis]